jgi:hypothetical protein
MTDRKILIESRDESGPSRDPAIYGPLYREFALEDSQLAEQGLADFASGLAAEDRDGG